MKKTFLFSICVALTICSFHSTSPLLIVGTRSRKTKEGHLVSKCLICRNDKDLHMKVYSTRNWITLFFIPVKSYGKKKCYLKCPLCKNYYILPGGIDLERSFKKMNTNNKVIIQLHHKNKSQDSITLKLW